MATYIPKQGDLVALTFDPQAGHEQNGKGAIARWDLEEVQSKSERRKGYIIGGTP